MTRARRPKRSDLFWRSGDLKRALVDFAQEPRFDDALDDALERRHGPTTTELDDAAFANLLDYVELQYRLPDGGTVVEQFVAEHPELAAERARRQAVLGYLNEPSIPPHPEGTRLRRLAEPDPERASRVFRRVLRQPGFSWARDGEALLRRHKASYFAQPVLPSVTPFSQTLAQAQRAAPEAGQREPTRRRSAQRPRSGARRRSGRPR